MLKALPFRWSCTLVVCVRTWTVLLQCACFDMARVGDAVAPSHWRFVSTVAFSSTWTVEHSHSWPREPLVFCFSSSFLYFLYFCFRVFFSDASCVVRLWCLVRKMGGFSAVFLPVLSKKASKVSFESSFLLCIALFWIYSGLKSCTSSFVFSTAADFSVSQCLCRAHRLVSHLKRPSDGRTGFPSTAWKGFAVVCR